MVLTLILTRHLASRLFFSDLPNSDYLEVAESDVGSAPGEGDPRLERQAPAESLDLLSEFAGFLFFFVIS